ncbi:hypothetical protein PBAT_18640 [Paenibacillus antarcticus]|uniref:Uncharacterized protein n=1 Tax=Paenibacillus antarcticus TaxID=253703 RepID=A0A168LFK9_9BACL|nr:hypothetical protein PBAT_18640 [Paenibacillus antarcticus]
MRYLLSYPLEQFKKLMTRLPGLSLVLLKRLASIILHTILLTSPKRKVSLLLTHAENSPVNIYEKAWMRKLKASSSFRPFIVRTKQVAT